MEDYYSSQLGEMGVMTAFRPDRIRKERKRFHTPGGRKHFSVSFLLCRLAKKTTPGIRDLLYQVPLQFLIRSYNSFETCVVP